MQNLLNDNFFFDRSFYSVHVLASTNVLLVEYYVEYYVASTSIVRFERGKKVIFWNPPAPRGDLAVKSSIACMSCMFEV